MPNFMVSFRLKRWQMRIWLKSTPSREFSMQISYSRRLSLNHMTFTEASISTDAQSE